MKKDIYVIGHKNPDTDSICSALAYAYFKSQTADGNYIACRAGELNPETEYVINYFNLETPILVEDLRPQVKDISYQKSMVADENIPMRKAWEILENGEMVLLPLVDQKSGKRLKGVVAEGDIAKTFMSKNGRDMLAKAKTPIANIIETLDAELVCGDTSKIIENGEIAVATVKEDIDGFGVKKDDIVMLADSKETQEYAIQKGAGVLIVSMGSMPSKEIIKQAEANGCIIIKSKKDMYVTARMLNQSIRVGSFMRSSDTLLSFSENDLIDDVKEAIVDTRYREFPVIAENGDFLGMLSRADILRDEKKQAIMVDHNEKSQAALGMSKTEVLEVVDHHKIGKLQTTAPIFYKNRPVGCTSTIIYSMFKEKEVDIPKKIAGAMCSAILSDTLLYRSPTCTQQDKSAAEDLARIAGIDTEKYAFDMFAAGSDFGSKTEEEIFNLDYKTFALGDMTYGVGQVQSVNKKELDDMKEKMLAYMQSVVDRGEADMVYLMLTDILAESSELLCAGTKALETATRAFKVEAGDRSVYLKGAVSRKKQIIPQLTEALK